MLSDSIRDISFGGSTYRFHRPNGRPWTLYWSDGWETVREATKALGWVVTDGGPGTYGHTTITLPEGN